METRKGGIIWTFETIGLILMKTKTNNIMPSTYSQLNVHCVFAVKGRKNQLHASFRSQLFQYMSGILKNIEVYPLAVGGWVDHVHLFFELPVNQKLPDIIRVVKANSSRWVNKNQLISEKFQWQSGYAAFSYAKSQRNRVINYIKNQEQHHRKKSFKEEIIRTFEKFEMNYDEKYLFEFYGN